MSFLPVIERKKHTVRTAALIEQCRGESRGIPDCSGYNFNGARTMTPGFEGVITDRYKYVEFEDGSSQLIDLQKDPHEFHDLSRNPGSAGLKRQMAREAPRARPASPADDDRHRPRRVTRPASRRSRTSRRPGSRPTDADWSATARPFPGAPVRVGSSPSTISSTVGIGSRSQASRKAARSIARRRPAASRWRRAAPMSRSSATRQRPEVLPTRRSRTAARCPARSSSVAWSRSRWWSPGGRATRPGSRSAASPKAATVSTSVRGTRPTRSASPRPDGSSGSTPPDPP